MAPLPFAMVMTSLAASAFSASRTTGRLTPNSCARLASDGKSVPGAKGFILDQRDEAIGYLFG